MTEKSEKGIKFSAQELAVGGEYLYLKVGHQGPEARRPDLGDLAVAVGLSEKFKGCLDAEQKNCVDSELILSTAEKSLLLKYLGERGPEIARGKAYLDLKAKLQ